MSNSIADNSDNHLVVTTEEIILGLGGNDTIIGSDNSDIIIGDDFGSFPFPTMNTVDFNIGNQFSAARFEYAFNLHPLNTNPNAQGQDRLPTISIRRETVANTTDFYRFYVLEDNTEVIIDIDNANGGPDNIDTIARILDSTASNTIIQVDNFGLTFDPGSSGSGLNEDPLIQLTLNKGLYFVEVGLFNGSSTNPPGAFSSSGQTYDIHLASGAVEGIITPDERMLANNPSIGNDIISGGNGDDQLFGQAGNDLITGGLGSDFIIGGTGDFDTANYGQSLQGVNINLRTSYGTGGEAEGDFLSGIEQVIGSLFSDVITGDDANNVFFGFDGDDQLFGGEGSDFLLGGAGADHLDGGNGILDTADYRASQLGVTVDLVAGTGLGGDAEGDTLVNIDQLLGSALGDSLTGNNENNILFGFAGDDTLSGGIGNDFLVSGLGIDTLNGGPGSDTANYLSSAENISVSLVDNLAVGGEAEGDTFISIENIIATNSVDVLRGNSEDNLLFGFGGDDFFYFTAGIDTLNGGADIDTVIFEGNQADFGFQDRSDLGAGVVFVADGTGQNVSALFDIERVSFNDTGTFDLTDFI